jgi:hypothetical protein
MLDLSILALSLAIYAEVFTVARLTVKPLEPVKHGVQYSGAIARQMGRERMIRESIHNV